MIVSVLTMVVSITVYSDHCLSILSRLRITYLALLYVIWYCFEGCGLVLVTPDTDSALCLFIFINSAEK